MENANNISYIIQLTDNGSEHGKSMTSNAENLAYESLYQFLSFDLTYALKATLKSLQEKDLQRIEFIRVFVDQISKNQLPLIYKIKLSNEIEITPAKVLSILHEMTEVLEKLGYSKISFSTESELISIFQIIFSESLFESEIFCLISSIIYKSIKETTLANWKDVHYLLFVNVFLLQYGLKMCSKDIEDYPLHKAVYENSISDLIELLYNSSSGNYFYLGLEDCDPLGNTPLALAVKTKNIEAIVILLEYCADPSNQPSHRCSFFIPISCRIAFSPIVEAVILRDREILKLLLKAEYRHRQLRFSQCRALFSGILSGIPDFSMDLVWSCESPIIPFIHSFVQPEGYKLYKRGGDLRIDLCDNVEGKAPHSTILYKGETKELLTYDHINKVVHEMVADIDNEDLDSAADELLKSKTLKEDVSLKEVRMERDKGRTSTLSIDGRSFLIVKNKAQCKYQTKSWKRKKQGKHYDFPKKSFLFTAYFDWIKRNNCSLSCPRHSNCNLSVLWKIAAIKQLLLAKGADYLKTKMPNSGADKLYTKAENKVSAELWVCNHFPLSLQNILPLLDVLSKSNPVLSKFAEFLKNTPLINSSLLPIKTVFPVAFAVRVQIQFLHISLSSPKESWFKFDNTLYVLQVEQNSMSRLMRPVRLTPHSRKKFKFMKKQKLNGGEGLEEITEEQVFSFPNSIKNAAPHQEIDIAEEIKKLDEKEGLENPNISILTANGEENKASSGEEMDEVLNEKDKNETLKVKSHVMDLGRISTMKTLEESGKPIPGHFSKRTKKPSVVVKVNLADTNEGAPQAGLAANEEASLYETQKFDLPSLNKTLKSKALVSLNSRNRMLISETHGEILLEDDNLVESRNNRTSINAPKSFDKNMKQTHRLYLMKREVKKIQPMKKKNLKIEIPEPPKEDELMINHAELVKKLRNYIDKKSGQSTSKKKTTDVDIDYL